MIKNHKNTDKYNEEVEKEVLKILKEEIHQLNVNNENLKEIFATIYDYEKTSGTTKAKDKYLRLLSGLSNHINSTGPLISLTNLFTLVQ